MDGLKIVGFFVKWLAFAVWGVTVIDVLPMLLQGNLKALELFESANSTITFLTALFGLIFFLVKGLVFVFVELPHKKKSQKLERDIMTEDLIHKRNENIDEQKKTVINYGKTVVPDFLLYLVA